MLPKDLLLFLYYFDSVDWHDMSLSFILSFQSGVQSPQSCQAPLFMGILQARLLEWVAISFSRGSSQPGDRTWVSCIAGRFFTIWAMREPLREAWCVLILLSYFLFSLFSPSFLKGWWCFVVVVGFLLFSSFFHVVCFLISSWQFLWAIKPFTFYSWLH